MAKKFGSPRWMRAFSLRNLDVANALVKAGRNWSQKLT